MQTTHYSLYKYFRSHKKKYDTNQVCKIEAAIHAKLSTHAIVM